MADYTYKLDMAGFLWEITIPIALDMSDSC